MQAEVRTGFGTSVAGTFRSVVEAERALDALREVGVPPERVSMSMGEQHVEKSAIENIESRGTNVGGGAATGATLGGLVGILWGWIAGSGVLSVPGAVATVSASQLSSTITGLAIGASVGALIGALVGVGMPELEASDSQDEADERRIFVTVQLAETEAGEEAARAIQTLQAHGALQVRALGVAIQGGDANLAVEKDVAIQQVEVSVDNLEENSIMQDRAIGPGEDPEAVTGTRDAIDPETGALGTAGTPMTTGYGVSGSTIGTGSVRGQGEQESGDFAGAMPDTDAYEMGGRGSGDSPSRGIEHDTPVVEKISEIPADEAPVQSEPANRDAYERGSSYGAPTEKVAAAISATDFYSTSDVETPPTYGNVETESTQESAGTNIPGTSDVRGLGDNTDDRQ